MRIVLFYHSLVSDWNHGNAHFLRGIASELLSRGHDVQVFEPAGGWSLQNLLQNVGPSALEQFHSVYPALSSSTYDLRTLDLNRVLDGADLVIAHEWNDHELIARLSAYGSRQSGTILLFHDTHHRAVTDRGGMAAYDLRHFEGVLAYGEVLRDLYIREGWTGRAWTWHEGADTRVFHPNERSSKQGDLVWIGNWGDDERSAEIQEFLIGPVRKLGLTARVYGVRYPTRALYALEEAGIEYGGWLPNYRVPEVFGRYKITIHIPRRPYVESLPGIPTIRMFEALACEMPLISAPWSDVEGLFSTGLDYLIAADGREMTELLDALMCNPDTACAMGRHGVSTIWKRHTCAHRVDQLLSICKELRGDMLPNRVLAAG